MKEIKINIEGCMEDVAKVLKHLEQGGFLTQKNMSSGINKEGMNTTATYEVMPEDSEDRTEPEPFMPKKGEVCALYNKDCGTLNAVFIATGKVEKNIHGEYNLLAFVAVEPSLNLSNPTEIVTDEDKLYYYQNNCRPATSEEIDFLLKVLKDEGYSWDPIGCKLIKNKYVPEMGEWYFSPFIDVAADPPFSDIRNEWHGLNYDMDLLKKGWVFRTKEEAQALCDKLNEAIEGIEV